MLTRKFKSFHGNKWWSFEAWAVSVFSGAAKVESIQDIQKRLNDRLNFKGKERQTKDMCLLKMSFFQVSPQRQFQKKKWLRQSRMEEMVRTKD